MSTLRSEWKYMLPFDLDLASSGFVDAHGQRISVSNLIARNPRAAQKFLKELSSLIGQRIQATEVSVPKRCPSGPSLLSLLGISDDS
ncbi:STK33 [Symbiodinium natans]|uniref:STK33 protein n=1 Tax=Symbiodinium natans TaxID=878477 RepID=A0A812R1B2_9DINO|nr:STK33 [Symbiodinium natans]